MSTATTHVLLHVEGAGRPNATQAVPVRRRADGLLEIVCSPGFVEGVAAGDVVRVVDVAFGAFEVVSRGGNLAIKVFHEESVAPVSAWLQPRLEALGGWLDGGITRAVVFTVPMVAGFRAVETELERACEMFPGTTWFFGNVYDGQGRPLNWWE